MTTYNIITNGTKKEKAALKSISTFWAKNEIKLGRTPESVLSQLKTDKNLQHKLSQKAFKYAKEC